MQAYGAQQRSVALQVTVLHFDATVPAATAGSDKTIPAYPHTLTTNTARRDRIVRLMAPSW